ncbi:hypothetical protein EDD15DRAFT_2200935 [Pisolithus albus]|nr:hypothetical protein EDD15DRAFT_2200935 [Pisolithus albus]
MPLAASAHLSHPGSQAPVQAVSSKFDTLQSTTPTETSWYLIGDSLGVLAYVSKSSRVSVRKDQPALRYVGFESLYALAREHKVLRHWMPMQEIFPAAWASRVWRPTFPGRTAMHFMYWTPLQRLPTREIFRGCPYMQYFEPHGLLVFDVPHFLVVVRVLDPAMAWLPQECICLEWSQL